MNTSDNAEKQDMAEQVRFILQTGKKIHENLIVNRARIISKSLGGNISLNQLHMIRLVHRREQTSVKELAQLLRVSPPSVSAMVERLVERGLLNREQNSHDRRQVVLSLTPQAARSITKLENDISKELETLADKIGPDTTRKWFQVMQEINSVIDQDERL